MKAFDALIAEAEAADVSGWGFDWLAGRASEERPPWGYARLLAQRLAGVESALDVDTGGGEVLDEAPRFPPRMCATEAWPPNVRKARGRLGARGVQVVEVASGTTLPFADASFELVTSRHPVRPDWAEIHRVLQPGGRYFAQHVGPASAHSGGTHGQVRGEGQVVELVASRGTRFASRAVAGAITVGQGASIAISR